MAGGHEKMQAVHVTAQGSTAEEGRRKEITYISKRTTVYMPPREALCAACAPTRRYEERNAF